VEVWGALESRAILKGSIDFPSKREAMSRCETPARLDYFI
jgi:hypothetical protein